MCVNKMMYKVVNVSISRAISERITIGDCVTNERRLRDFSTKSGGDRLNFHGRLLLKLNVFTLTLIHQALISLK